MMGEDGDGPRHHNQRHQKSGEKRLLFSIGSTLKDRWKIESLIDEGGFGQIYKALDTCDGHRAVAVKGEALNAPLPLLRMELSVMKDIQRTTPSPHFLRFHGCGGAPTGNFIVMDLAGRTMMDAKKSTPQDRLTPGTSLRLGCQILAALHHLHDAGWLHRDVKPSNFCFGRHHSSRQTLFLIDFGLCRNYLDSRGDLRAPRSRCGFRGTLRYASINIHQGKDMGRQDDLWSTFYMLLEQMCGQVPWRRVNDKPKVLDMKRNTDFSQLLENCPPSLTRMKEDLESLDFYSQPEYDELIARFQQDLDNLHISHKDPFDWETPTQASQLSIKPPGTPCPSLIQGLSSQH